VKVMIARVDPARRELDLAITELLTKSGHPDPNVKAKPKVMHKKKSKGKIQHRGGATKRNARSKRRSR
jgi:hypothetical protein